MLCYYQRPRRRLNYPEHSTEVHRRVKEDNPPLELPVIGSKSNREAASNREFKKQGEKRKMFTITLLRQIKMKNKK